MNYYSCILYGDEAKRFIKAKVTTKSLICITGMQHITTYKKADNSKGTKWKSL